MVWSCGREGDPLLYSSGLTDPAHREPVSQVKTATPLRDPPTNHTHLLQVCWVMSSQDERQYQSYRLLSVGCDGILMVWRCPRQGSQLTAMLGYRLLAESVPRSLRAGRARGDTILGGEHTLSRSSDVLWCVGTSLSFSGEDSSLAVVGCENGCLLKCSLHTDTDVGLNSVLSKSSSYAHILVQYILLCQWAASLFNSKHPKSRTSSKQVTHVPFTEIFVAGLSTHYTKSR